MKVVNTLLLASILLFSCASSSQNNISPEVKRKIAEISKLLKASPEQTQQMLLIENTFLSKSNVLRKSEKNYPDNIAKLQQKRNKSFKKILSRDQYIKLSAIERSRDKDLPVRF